MAHLTQAGIWTAERAHSPSEASTVECKDCGESLADADEEFCAKCGEPTCLQCQETLDDEPICGKCLFALVKAALESFKTDALRVAA